nr:MAG: hypothetical protein [Microviridae sp.]
MSALLDSQNSIEDGKNSNSNELIEKIEIKKTPFHLVKENEKPMFLALGLYRMTENMFLSEKEAEEWIEENKWDLITNVCMLITGLANNKIKES